MLVLSRRVNEAIVINDTVTVQVLQVTGDKVRLGIAAPVNASVCRQELVDARRQHLMDSAASASAESTDVTAGSQPIPPPQAKPSTQGSARPFSPSHDAAGVTSPSAAPPDPDALIRDLFDDDPAQEQAARALASLFSQSPAVKALAALLQALRTERNPAVRPVLVDAVKAIGGKIFLAKAPNASEDAPPIREHQAPGGHLQSSETSAPTGGPADEPGASLGSADVLDPPKALEDSLRPVFAGLPDNPQERLAVVSRLYYVMRKEAARVLEPAIMTLLENAESLNHEQKDALARQVNQVLSDARLTILNPVTNLPTSLMPSRARPSSTAVILRVQDTRRASDGRQHTLRADEVVRRGLRLAPTVCEFGSAKQLGERSR